MCKKNFTTIPALADRTKKSFTSVLKTQDDKAQVWLPRLQNNKILSGSHLYCSNLFGVKSFTVLKFDRSQTI